MCMRKCPSFDDANLSMRVKACYPVDVGHQGPWTFSDHCPLKIELIGDEANQPNREHVPCWIRAYHPSDLDALLTYLISAISEESDDPMVPQHLQLLADLRTNVLIEWVKFSKVALEAVDIRQRKKYLDQVS